MVRQQRIAAQMKPLAIELFAGFHGWGAGFAAAGFRVVGFDIANMGKAFGAQTPDGCQLVIQDVLTLHGSQFRDAAVIVASPPCQNYSYLAMPWSRSKDPNNSKAAKALRHKWETEGPDNRLFDACFRIQREAIEATRKPCVWIETGDCVDYVNGPCPMCGGPGYTERYIPLIVENVRGAQPWVGRSAWNYGSFHLWGDVPALMPFANRVTPKRAMDDLKNGVCSAQGDRGDGIKQLHSRGDNQTCGKHRMGLGDGTNQAKSSRESGGWFNDYKADGNGKCVGISRTGSKSNARKMASAMIAKIPRELAEHIARVYYPPNAKTAQP